HPTAARAGNGEVLESAPLNRTAAAILRAGIDSTTRLGQRDKLQGGGRSSINHRDCPVVGSARRVVAAKVWHVNPVSRFVDRQPVRVTPDTNVGEGKGRAVDHRYRPIEGLAGGIAAAFVGNVDFVGGRIDRHGVRPEPGSNAGVGRGPAVDHRYRPVGVALAGNIAVAIGGNVNLVGDRIDRCRIRIISADGDIRGGKARAVNHRHSGCALTAEVVAAVIGHVDLVSHRVDVYTIGIDPHSDRSWVIGHAVDDRHCPGTAVGGVGGAGGIGAARVCHVNLVSHQVDYWGGRASPSVNSRSDGIVHAVNHAHRPAVGIAREVGAAMVCDVDVVGHRVHRYAVRITLNGDGGNDGIAHAVNHRYRPVARAGGVAAALVGDVNRVGHRVHRHG